MNGASSLNTRNLRSLQRRKESKKWTFAVCLFLVSASAAAVMYFLVGHFLKVNEIVLSGTKHLKGEEVAVLLNTGKGDGLFSATGKDMSMRLKKSPWIKNASIRKDLSGRISVKIEEAVPAAILKIYDNSYLVAEDGTVLEQMGLETFFLPVIREIDPARNRETFRTAMDFVRVLHNRGAIAYKSDLEITGQRPEDVTLRFDNISIRIGSGDFEKKLERLSFVRDEIGKRNMNVEYIDLRFLNKVIVKPANHDVIVKKQ